MAYIYVTVLEKKIESALRTSTIMKTRPNPTTLDEDWEEGSNVLDDKEGCGEDSQINPDIPRAACIDASRMCCGDGAIILKSNNVMISLFLENTV